MQAIGLVLAGSRLTRTIQTPRSSRALSSRLLRTMSAATKLDGKVFLVTGCTDGIGKHTATQLADHGATVIVHGRNPMKVADVSAALQGSGNGKVAAYTYDLSSLAQVRDLASAIKRDFGKIDVLVNNAGVYCEEPRQSADGLEMTWAVNVAALFLLTQQLLPVTTGRVVNVSSISAGGPLDFDNLQQEQGFSSHGAYSQSKLAVQAITRSLAARLEAGQLQAGAPGVKAVTLDPGTVNTKMLHAGWGPIGMQLRDANDLFWISTAPNGELEDGGYYVQRRLSRPARAALDTGTQQQLWDILEVQTGTGAGAGLAP